MYQLGDARGFGSFRFEPVSKLGERIKADYVDAVSDEVRERVDVVVEALTVAIVGDVFDAADLDAGVLHDAFDVSNDFARRFEAFHAKSGLWGIDGACSAVELNAAGGAADVRRAEVEGFAGDVDFDGVE